MCRVERERDSRESLEREQRESRERAYLEIMEGRQSGRV